MRKAILITILLINVYAVFGITISGTVFNDLDGNSSFDIGESGIANVTVNLYNQSNITQTTLSDINGEYFFTGDFENKTYIISSLIPENYMRTTPTNVSIEVLSNGTIIPSNITNFGFKQGNATIFALVFNDTNQNGVYDNNETGIPAVNVTFESKNISTIIETDINGTSVFTTSLGDFIKVCSDFNSYYPTSPQCLMINPFANQNYTITFGYSDVHLPNSTIYGIVFNDLNQNGIKDNNESGLLGANVSIFNLDSIMTSSNGLFEFFIEGNKTYQINEINPIGYSSTTPDTLSIFVGLNQSYYVEFGDYKVCTLMYKDSDNDGYGDPSISKVTCDSGYVGNNLDCDDSNFFVNPGVDDICNGIDDNCNTKVDENNICDFNDDDNDGVLNAIDRCPGTTGEVVVAGCSCDQILAQKPGKSKGLKCNKGVTNVFRKRVGWAK